MGDGALSNHFVWEVPLKDRFTPEFLTILNREECLYFLGWFLFLVSSMYFFFFFSDILIDQRHFEEWLVFGVNIKYCSFCSVSGNLRWEKGTVAIKIRKKINIFVNNQSKKKTTNKTKQTIKQQSLSCLDIPYKHCLQ